MSPGAAADEVTGVNDDGVLRLRVRAVPADGRANDSVRRLIARELDTGVTRVRITAGHGSRSKQIEVDDVDTADLELRWPGLRLR